MSQPIGIVTAFFDIGRGDWTADKGLPPHLFRPVDVYFERFAHLARLDNPMVIYTSPDLAPRVRELRAGREGSTAVIEVPFMDMFYEMRGIIARIQKDPAYQARINPKEKNNPEYWSANYVLVNMLKSAFVCDAIQNNLISFDQIAWLDFGYCRGAQALASSTTMWRYDFIPDKINVFGFGPYLGNPPLPDVVFNNVICLIGTIIVAQKHLWQELLPLINRAFLDLTSAGLIDDDQTLLLMASLYRPDLFHMHEIVEKKWLFLLRKFQAD